MLLKSGKTKENIEYNTNDIFQNDGYSTPVNCGVPTVFYSPKNDRTKKRDSPEENGEE
jgi:hypothetical protein